MIEDACVVLGRKRRSSGTRLARGTWTVVRLKKGIDMPNCPVQAAAADADGAGRGAQLEPIEPLAAGSSIIKKEMWPNEYN